MRDNIPDMSDLFDQHDREQMRLMRKLPICYECNEYIQSEYVYNLCGHDCCEDCMEEMHDDGFDFDKRRNTI